MLARFPELSSLHQSDLLCSFTCFLSIFLFFKRISESLYTLDFFHQMLLSCCSIFNELCRRLRSLSEPLSLTACILYHIHITLSIPFFIFFSLFFTFRALHNPFSSVPPPSRHFAYIIPLISTLFSFSAFLYVLLKGKASDFRPDAFPFIF